MRQVVMVHAFSRLLSEQHLTVLSQHATNKLSLGIHSSVRKAAVAQYDQRKLKPPS